MASSALPAGERDARARRVGLGAPRRRGRGASRHRSRAPRPPTGPASTISSSSSSRTPSRADSTARRASASHRAAGRPESVACCTARSRCARMPAASPAAASAMPAPGLEPARAERARMLGGDRRGAVDPRPGLVDVAEVEDRPSPSRRRPGTRGSDRRSPSRTRWASSALRERQVGDHLRAREHVRAVEHLRLERRALALVRERLHPRRRAGGSPRCGGPSSCRDGCRAPSSGRRSR